MLILELFWCDIGGIMELYFAPLEGITTYTYRNTHAEFFGYCDTYYAPFITPSDNEKNSRKNMRDILTKIERMSVKYIKLVFVGNISDKSHIDSIEMQASRKYNNKIR